MRCADCGVEIERVPAIGGRWAQRRENGWYTTCRVVADGNRVVSADYHYVEGETQRHFEAQP